MPSIINRVPTGLLSALDLKARGQNPHLLDDLVSPQIDLWPLYIAGREHAEQVVVAAPAAPWSGWVAALTVPEGEAWYVLRYNVGIDGTGPGAGDTVKFAPGYYSFLRPSVLAPPTGRGQMNIGDFVTCTQDEFLTAYMRDPPLILSSGDILGVQVGRLIGFNVSFMCRAFYYRMPL